MITDGEELRNTQKALKWERKLYFYVNPEKKSCRIIVTSFEVCKE
jgi:hypothetical protein